MGGLATDPTTKSVAETRRAAALFDAAGEKPTPQKIEEVHSILQQSLNHNPKNAAALFLDGRVMAFLGRVEEARTDFSQCAACVSPSDPARVRAEHFAADPALALHRMAPPFEVTALDGSHFILDAMGGRVVLLGYVVRSVRERDPAHEARRRAVCRPAPGHPELKLGQ